METGLCTCPMKAVSPRCTSNRSGPEEKTRIAKRRRQVPIWLENSGQRFYRNRDAIMAATPSRPRCSPVGARRLLFRRDVAISPVRCHGGRRFEMIIEDRDSTPHREVICD